MNAITRISRNSIRLAHVSKQIESGIIEFINYNRENFIFISTRIDSYLIDNERQIYKNIKDETIELFLYREISIHGNSIFVFDENGILSMKIHLDKELDYTIINKNLDWTNVSWAKESPLNIF